MDAVLLELALLFALCVAVAVAFHRFRLPPIVGFLVTGALVGPYSVRLVQHEEVVRELAEVGVVVLLFTVGMEVPFGQLRMLKRLILVGGGLQLSLTIGLATLLALAAGMAWNVALLLGFLLSLSSTAAVSKVLVDHGEFGSPHGQLGIGICVAQDLAVVPMILLVPLLSGGEGAADVVGTLRNLGILVGVVLLAKLLVPRILDLVARTRSRELFVLTLATVCLSLAAVTAHLGMSLALGAFIAGILLADTEHHAHAAAEVEPFRDALASLFFVSIGMLFDWRTIVEAPWLVLLALAAVLAGKTAVVMLAARVLGQPGWVQLRAGLLLAQVGEFSFVLATQAGGEALPAQARRIFLVVAVLSIALTPLLFGLGRTLVARARRRDGDTGSRGQQRSGLQDHAIVIGYGPTGRTVVQGLRSLGLPVVAAEMNLATVRAEKAKGVPIVLADATRVPVLKALGIERARLLVLAVNDAGATTRISHIVRQVAPHVHVLARAAYIAEVERLQQSGAHEVVPQELEASVEILVRVLRRFLVPDDEVGRQVAQLRQGAYGSGKARSLGGGDAASVADLVPGLGLSVFEVAADAEAAGRSIADLGVRKRTGCSVVAVRRGGSNLVVIAPETQFGAGDVVVVIGPRPRLADAGALFHTSGGRAAAEPAAAEPPATESPR